MLKEIDPSLLLPGIDVLVTDPSGTGRATYAVSFGELPGGDKEAAAVLYDSAHGCAIDRSRYRGRLAYEAARKAGDPAAARLAFSSMCSLEIRESFAPDGTPIYTSMCDSDKCSTEGSTPPRRAVIRMLSMLRSRYLV